MTRLSLLTISLFTALLAGCSNPPEQAELSAFLSTQGEFLPGKEYSAKYYNRPVEHFVTIKSHVVSGEPKSLEVDGAPVWVTPVITTATPKYQSMIKTGELFTSRNKGHVLYRDIGTDKPLVYSAEITSSQSEDGLWSHAMSDFSPFSDDAKLYKAVRQGPSEFSLVEIGGRTNLLSLNRKSNWRTQPVMQGSITENQIVNDGGVVLDTLTPLKTLTRINSNNRAAMKATSDLPRGERSAQRRILNEELYQNVSNYLNSLTTQRQEIINSFPDKNNPVSLR